jgi:hypothetical protein
LVFFPWAWIVAPACPSGITLHRYEPADKQWSDDIHHIVRAYERCAGQRVESATVVAYDGVVGGCVNDDQVEATFAFREAISFAALRQRKYFHHSDYWNDHTFACIAQSYVAGKPGATGISRRRDGKRMTTWAKSITG